MSLMLKLTKLIGGNRHSMPLEGLLRPEYEYFPAILAFYFAGVFILVPFIMDIELFFLTKYYSYLTGLVFFILGTKRYFEGKYIRTYKKYIKNQPTYKISEKELYEKHINPNKKSKRIFLGKGFRWTGVHTQRFYDLEALPVNAKYKSIAEHPLGGFPHIHGVGSFEEVDFYIERADRNGHLLLYGQSRSGKSRDMELFIEQDVAHGECVIVIDPKGDKDVKKRVILACERAGRLDDLKMIHLGFLKDSAKYNPVKSYQRVSEVAGRISSKLPGEGDSQAFAQFAWRFLFIAASAMEAVNEEITIKNLKKYIRSFDEILVKYSKKLFNLSDEQFNKEVLNKQLDEKFIPGHLNGKSKDTVKLVMYIESEKKGEVDEILANILSAYEYDKTYYDKITASLLPFLEQLSAVDEITSTGSDTNSLMPELIIEEAIKKKQVIFIGLDGLSDNVISKAFGSMFFADLVSTAGKMYKTQEMFNPVMVHADEFNDVIGPDFIPLLNKAGGAGIIVTAYTQTDDDINLGFEGGSAQIKAAVAKGNFRTVGTMRVATKDTAEYFTQRLSDVNVKYTVQATSMQDSDSELRGKSASTGDSLKDKDVPLVDAASIMSQPVGQAFFAKNGNNIYHVRSPLIKEDLTRIIGDISKDGLGNIMRKVNLGTLKIKVQDVVKAHANNPQINSNDKLMNLGGIK